jgi:hypothetical protein
VGNPACPVKPFGDRFKNASDLDIHADPVRTGSPVTINAAINVQPFDANIRLMGASISPPFRRSKQSDYRRSGGNGQMRGASITADINLCTARECAKTFQRKTDSARFVRFRRAHGQSGKFIFTRTIGDE